MLSSQNEHWTAAMTLDELEDRGNVRSYVDRGRQLRRYSDRELFAVYKAGLARWAADMLDFQLMHDADAEFKLRAITIPFDDECRRIVEQGVARLASGFALSSPVG